MKRKLLGPLAILFCSVVTFSACTKEEGITEGKISYQMEPTNQTASVGTTVSESGLVVDVNANSSLTWKAGHVIIHELNFEAKKGDREIEYKLTKPATVDLFKLSQEFGSISIPAGTYKEVGFELVLKKQTTGNVFSISGIYKDETAKETTVEFIFNEDVNIKLEAENLTVGSSEAYKGLLKLHLNKLVSQVNSADLKSVDRNANGTIVISSTKNANLYNKIKAGFISFIKAEFKH